MTDIENHMVANLEAEIDRLYGPDEWEEEKGRDSREQLKVAAEKLLCGETLLGSPIDVNWHKGLYQPEFDFSSVITLAWEDDSFPDCVKEILSLYPDSKLAKLVRHMAVVTAADALDIDI